jgi:hypothetical protein
LHSTAATSTHATAACHATADTCMSASANTAAPAATTVVLSQDRSGDCQTERQGCRADNSEFRHSASPQKVSGKTSALADGSGSEVILGSCDIYLPKPPARKPETNRKKFATNQRV